MRVEDDDRSLVAASLDGDRAAFGRLIDRHRARAEAVVRGMLGDLGETEDVVQEALLAAYLGLERLRRPERFGGWLCAIAANLAKMRLRQRGAFVSFDELGGRRLPSTALDGISPEQALEAAELLALVLRSLASAPARRRAPLLRRRALLRRDRSAGGELARRGPRRPPPCAA